MGLVDSLRRSPLLTRLLFGVRVPARTRQAHWDLTTLRLCRALRATAGPGARLLEVGVGEAAVLSVWAARALRARVTAVDLEEAVLERARRSAEANGVLLELRPSDLLAAVSPAEAFDVVVFNPPYVPTALGVARGLLEHEPRRVWDGGTDGLAIVDRFLEQAPLRLSGSPVILLGVNARLVSVERLLERLPEGLRHEHTFRGRLNPAVAVCLRCRPRAGA